MTDDFALFTVCASPPDHPGRFVVRRILVSREAVQIDLAPHAVVASLADARGAIPSGLVCVPRSGEDDATIVEVWL